MSRGPDVATLLQRAIEGSAMAADCAIIVTESDWQHWASATFVGARHHLVLTAKQGAALDRWLTALPEAELDLRGHLLADITLLRCEQQGSDRRITIEALTVEDR